MDSPRKSNGEGKPPANASTDSRPADGQVGSPPAGKPVDDIEATVDDIFRGQGPGPSLASGDASSEPVEVPEEFVVVTPVGTGHAKWWLAAAGLVVVAGSVWLLQSRDTSPTPDVRTAETVREAGTTPRAPTQPAPDPRVGSGTESARLGAAPTANVETPPSPEPAPIEGTAARPVSVAVAAPQPQEVGGADAVTVAYTVKPGDTLSEIARTQIGVDATYRTIYDANRSILEDPDTIYPGEVLQIPRREE